LVEKIEVNSQSAIHRWKEEIETSILSYFLGHETKYKGLYIVKKTVIFLKKADLNGLGARAVKLRLAEAQSIFGSEKMENFCRNKLDEICP